MFCYLMDKMDTVNEIAKESDLIILNTLTIILHNIHGFTLRKLQVCWEKTRKRRRFLRKRIKCITYNRITTFDFLVQRENAYIIMYARINYKVVFFQAPFFRYVLYGYTLYILYTSPRKMKEYVFFIRKRTLRLQRKSVKIAEKVQRAPIFLQK